ncbi:helicase C-terminal domain-containing protein [Delftia sp. PS-11]|uniref:helicase C-terminal domain-containing protein n=1 Tax=Delftia sp. PS-11 TaxID=2767222 RepID=UPI002457CAF8|nr:helicase C-terminal domain-containing protein [Delftia sp. PS-11]KAJ8744474.1 ATP-dependent DNA helicase [Delftia sp. PS-11]
MSYTVAVRALCEFTARAGDLDLRFTPAPSALEGMAGHRLVQSRRGPGYETEISLSGQYGPLCVRGRADGFDALAGQLEEIKTYRGQIEGVRAHHRALHWAQARIYAHLLCEARGLERLRVALVYFNVGTSQETVLVQEEDADQLRAFFEQQCALFLDWSRGEAAHRAARDAALQAMRFPLPDFRAGQRELAVAVYRLACAPQGGQCLMAQAPTGIGKTLGTLFPMLKAMPGQGLDRLFFLTAKGTGQALALQALASVNRQLAAQAPCGEPPPQLRVLGVLARDKACEHPGKACHGDDCPLARGFFDRLPAARAAALSQPAPWDPAAVRALALAHEVCPYYLAQELVRWSDVTVADYHYFYDTSAMLYALTQALQWKAGVLVDEAHNLLDRARRMYTAELSQFALAAARKAASAAVRKSLDRLQRSWSALNRAQAASYQAYDDVPGALLAAVQRAVAAIADANADAPMPPGDPVLAFYWEALQFMALAEQFGSHALFDVHLLPGRSSARGGPPSLLCIRNVVPAPHLAARHAAAHATVLFSGTLSPPHFYRDLLGLPEGTYWVEAESPFQAAQLDVQVAGHISTRYRDRERSLRPIADLVAAQYARRPGNYLCFVSSFDYLQRVADCLQQHHRAVPVWRQTPAMDEAGRAAFLARFAEGGQGVGFAVLGGAFSEGVDLPGERLIGAFVATLGLPQVNPVNERMKQAMDRHFGTDKGHDYSYLYPGLRKVVQAAGRVIRSEQDRGVVFLIDDRYRRAEVRALLPRWWQVDDGP